MNKVMDDIVKETMNAPYEGVCNLKYLDDMMGGKKNLIVGIIDAFLIQIPEEMKGLEEAVENSNFNDIRKLAHTMKSTVSIMGIASLGGVLQELEDLGTREADIDRIRVLNARLKLISDGAIIEIGKIRLDYIG